MFAYILFNPNHIHVNCETYRSKYLGAGFFYGIHGRKWHLLFFQPTHTHQFSMKICPPLRIHPSRLITYAQSLKPCWGSLWLPPSVTTFSQNRFLTPTFHPLITLPTLPYTPHACSMSWPPLSYTSVPIHTLFYIVTVNLCLHPWTFHSLPFPPSKSKGQD